MDWQVKIGDKFEWFVSLKESGVPTPILDKMPVIKQSAYSYWKIFNFLSSSRRVGFGPGRIPLSEIIIYCDLYLIYDIEERLFIAEVIQELDAYYVMKITEKSDKTEK